MHDVTEKTSPPRLPSLAQMLEAALLWYAEAAEENDPGLASAIDEALAFVRAGPPVALEGDSWIVAHPRWGGSHWLQLDRETGEATVHHSMLEAPVVTTSFHPAGGTLVRWGDSWGLSAPESPEGGALEGLRDLYVEAGLREHTDVDALNAEVRRLYLRATGVDLEGLVSDARQREAERPGGGPGHCQGCDQQAPDVVTYEVLLGSATGWETARYCSDCAVLAEANWNGDTLAIRVYEGEPNRCQDCGDDGPCEAHRGH